MSASNEPKRYDPDKDKIPYGRYKIVWDCASEKNMLVEVPDEFPCTLCKKDRPTCGHTEKDFDYSDPAWCPGFLHV